MKTRRWGLNKPQSRGQRSVFSRRTRKGAGAIDQGQNAVAPGVHLLFAAGKRPDRAAIKKFIASQPSVSLSHDPLDAPPLHLVKAGDEAPTRSDPAIQPDLAELGWLELLREGLTFDLEGLAPGPSCEFPEIEHRFDLERKPTGMRSETLRLNLGQHLQGGQRSVPVIRGMICLVRDLTHYFEEVEAIVWPPAKSAIGRRFFESVTTAWIEGGAFPALGLTAFKETVDGALQSVGLDYWIGQELRIEPPMASDKVAATRLGVRLINQLILLGGLEESERIVAPDGSRLVMRPSRNRKFVRVWHE